MPAPPRFNDRRTRRQHIVITLLLLSRVPVNGVEELCPVTRTINIARGNTRVRPVKGVRARIGVTTGAFSERPRD